MEKDIAELKEDMAAKDIQLEGLGTAIHKTEMSIDKIDEAIRGNGKEGLNSIVKRMDATLTALTGSLNASIATQINAAIEKHPSLAGKSAEELIRFCPASVMVWIA